MEKKDLIKISDYLWEIPKRGEMRVPARIYISEKMLDEVFRDRSLEQLKNVATLPGILNYSLAMPDIHEGYGFPIGGVAALEIKGGVISPGGVGYDINCGVRLLKSDVSKEEIKEKINALATEIYNTVPSGLGRGGKLKLDISSLDKVLKNGSRQLVESGYGEEKDLENCEANGNIPEAEPEFVSSHAKSRGRDQLGTIGSGNHFIEIQEVNEIFDEKIAESFGLFKNQICILIHTGSRGFGHQVATDYIRLMVEAMEKYKISLPDRELACAPFESEEGGRYFKAMAAAANFAWANRQLITHLVRKAWEKSIADSKKLETVYDVAHNIAKIEECTFQNTKKKVVIHRKGATRAFGPNNPEIPEKYRLSGQPVLIPGSMGTASYVLAGTNEAMETTFSSTCHGAGRRMSRTSAKKGVSGLELKKRLEEKGIVVRAASLGGLAEEAPEAYKDVEEVVEVVHQSKIAKKVARLKPLGIIKGN